MKKTHVRNSLNIALTTQALQSANPKHFVAVQSPFEIHRIIISLSRKSPLITGTISKGHLLFLDCSSNWLKNCLLHGVTTGF